jgi:hypothetical protein
MSSPFLQLKRLVEQCLAELGRRQLRPQEIWLSEESESLETARSSLLGLVRNLASEVSRLKAIDSPHFAGVTGLDEWLTIEAEAGDWQKELGKLRPEADAGHVKESLMSIRGRVSELLDRLAIRSEMRDPASDATNSTLAARTISGLMAERDHRELGLGLLQDGAADPWSTALEALEASVVDWSTRLGPEHRVQLEQLCHKLLEHLDAIARLDERSSALDRLSKAAGREAVPLRNIYERLVRVPSAKMDAGVASDVHYMASLAKRLVTRIEGSHGGIVDDHAGESLPGPVVELFQLLHLAVPRAPRKSGTATLSRREIELAFGRRLWSGSEQKEE